MSTWLRGLYQILQYQIIPTYLWVVSCTSYTQLCPLITQPTPKYLDPKKRNDVGIKQPECRSPRREPPRSSVVLTGIKHGRKIVILHGDLMLEVLNSVEFPLPVAGVYSRRYPILLTIFKSLVVPIHDEHKL